MHIQEKERAKLLAEMNITKELMNRITARLALEEPEEAPYDSEYKALQI